MAEIKDASSYLKLEEAQNMFSFRAPGGSITLLTLCYQLRGTDFGVLASATLREYISVVLSHPVWETKTDDFSRTFRIWSLPPFQSYDLLFRGCLHLQPTPKYTAPILRSHLAHADLPTWNCLPVSASPERCGVLVQLPDEETEHVGQTTPHRARLSWSLSRCPTWPQSD